MFQKEVEVAAAMVLRNQFGDGIDHYYCLHREDMWTIVEPSKALVDYYELFLKQCYPKLKDLNVTFEIGEQSSVMDSDGSEWTVYKLQYEVGFSANKHFNLPT